MRTGGERRAMISTFGGLIMALNFQVLKADFEIWSIGNLVLSFLLNYIDLPIVEKKNLSNVTSMSLVIQKICGYNKKNITIK